MGPKYLRTEQITGGPIIDMGQKSIHGRDCLVIILHLADQKTMEIVFLIVGMRKLLQKGGGLRRAGRAPLPISAVLASGPRSRCPGRWLESACFETPDTLNPAGQKDAIESFAEQLT